MPPNALKIKVGYGGIPAARLKEAQDHIERNETDFVPIGRAHLEAVVGAMIDAQDSSGAGEDRIRNIWATLCLEIMQIKAHGGMFGYGLVSLISGIALDFLERAETVNEDGLSILNSYANMLETIFDNKIRGDGAEKGMELARELNAACERYYKKHPPSKKSASL